MNGIRIISTTPEGSSGREVGYSEAAILHTRLRGGFICARGALYIYVGLGGRCHGVRETRTHTTHLQGCFDNLRRGALCVHACHLMCMRMRACTTHDSRSTGGLRAPDKQPCTR